MNINDAAKVVGLNSRTIRFYESKGLFGVTRDSNQYRNYDDETIEALKKIKMLRYIGVKISDIRLWQSGILSTDEMLKSRLKELKNEEKVNAEQVAACAELLSNGQDVISLVNNMPDNQMPDDQDSVLNDKQPNESPVYIGLDIGTTTISLVVLGEDQKTVYECYNIPNNSQIISDKAFHKIQSVEYIINKISALVDMAVKYHERIIAIGLTGQMHGILYIDNDGMAVSDLYTWQDKCGEELINESGNGETGGRTYCKYIEDISGEKVATGYGLVTHYYLMKNNLLPAKAHKFCTIIDYAGMILTDRKSPLTHVSNAASFGCFNCETNDFKWDKLDILGIDNKYLPEITVKNQIIGVYSEIPVIVAIGDNQASFIGTVDNLESSVLINIGTGSQLSMLSKDTKDFGYNKQNDSFEIRPFINDMQLKSYSALCGGYAYAILQQFVGEIVFYATGEAREQYDLLERSILDVHDYTGVKVNTTFNGTRQNPDKTGSIENITSENFSLKNLVYGFSEGIVNELYEKYLEMLSPKESENIKYITISGNGARKNKLIPQIIKKIFNKDTVMKNSEEEAAIGAAMFAGEYIKNGGLS